MRLLPSPSTSAKLFATGFTVGPIVDSLHNQCLLEYDLLPIAIKWPAELAAVVDNPTSSYLFCSSWTVPPLLGVAYVVLGGVLPRLFQTAIDLVVHSSTSSRGDDSDLLPLVLRKKNAANNNKHKAQNELRTRAIVAVLTTALIIKLSEVLETHPRAFDGLSSILLQHTSFHNANLVIMFAAALSQWAFLDTTLAALLAASLTSIGGPLSELPFVANGFWHYLPQAADYYPLANVQLLPPPASSALGWLLGGPTLNNEHVQDLALSSITGPCYFAVTMDAIALGRWFDSSVVANDDRIASTRSGK